VPALLLAVQSSHVNAIVVALALGFGIGVAGHLLRSRTLIITGILVIGLTSGYVAFVLQPGGG
jgi:hypothetical protein